jgi:hypothetical protein
VFIDMFDPDNQVEVGDSTAAAVYWTAAMRGVLASTTASTAERLTRLFGRAFAQSPYVTRN